MKLHKQKSGRCSKCRKDKYLEAHHVFPQRFYGNGIRNPFTILLCSECHKDIGQYIHTNHKLTIEQCARITWDWLKGKKIII